MPIELTCSRCGSLIRYPDASAGHRVKCHVCNNTFVISKALDFQNDDADQPWWIPAAEQGPQNKLTSPACKETANDPCLTAMPPWEKGRRRLFLVLVLTSFVAVGSVTTFLLATRKTDSSVPSIGTHGTERAESVPRTQKPVPEVTQVKARIIGGVWLARDNGTDEVIRGLRLFVLKPEVEKSAITVALNSIKRKALDFANLLRRRNEGYMKGPIEPLLELAKQADSIANAIHAYERLPADALVNIDRIFALVTALDRLRERSEPWNRSPQRVRSVRVGEILDCDLMPSLPASALVGTVNTGIDGKYKTNQLPEGTYCLYAIHSTDVYVVTWLVKPRVTGPHDVAQDLWNENASSIITKAVR